MTVQTSRNVVRTEPALPVLQRTPPCQDGGLVVDVVEQMNSIYSSCALETALKVGRYVIRHVFQGDLETTN